MVLYIHEVSPGSPQTRQLWMLPTMHTFLHEAQVDGRLLLLLAGVILGLVLMNPVRAPGIIPPANDF